jgi:tetratricopeptide (TPR) repeat protein
MTSSSQNRSSRRQSAPQALPQKTASPSGTPSRRLYWLLATAIVLIAGALWLRSSRPVQEYLLRHQEISELEALLRRQPTNAVAQYYLGKKYYLSHRFPEARSAYQEAARLAPDWSRAHLGLALTHYELGEMDAARAEFRETLRHDDRSAWAEYMLGKLEWRQGRIEEALTHVRRSTELDPRSDQSWYGLAVCYAGKRQYDEAIAALRKAIERKENSAVYHTGLGELLVFRGELDAGKQHYERALQIDPDYGPACALMGRFYLDKVAGQDSQDRAEELLLRATKLETPRPASVYFDLGQIYTRKAQYAKAVEALQSSLRHDARDERAYYALANAYRRMGNKKAAAETDARFRNISALHVRMQGLVARLGHQPDNAPAQLELARVYRKLGLNTQAMQHYLAYLRLQPRSPEVVNEMEAFAQLQRQSDPGDGKQEFALPPLP